MDLWHLVQNQWESIIYGASIKRMGIALLILLLALLLRKIFSKVIIVFLRKLTQRTKGTLDDAIVEALEKPVQLAFIIIGLQIATQVLILPPEIGAFAYRVIRSLVLYTLFWSAYRAADVFSALFERRVFLTADKFDDMLVSFLSKGAKAVIIVLGSITIAQVWFTEIAGVLTGLGLGGLAFALAAQDTAKNLFGSVTIMLDRPFNIGDWVQTPSVEGTIEEIGFRSTKVRTFAQAVVTVPNSVMSNEAITNWSRMGKRRINFQLGVSYQTTAGQLQECVKSLRNILEDHPEVHPETILVYFERFGDNSLDIFVYFFTNTTNWQKFLEVQEDVNFKIMSLLEELGISVAFPSRSVYIETAKGEVPKEVGKIEFKGQDNSD
ncbi:small-conductance mechanosensitive channel [Desulfitobacterium dichloroeliminans LMG P-21439]|uniref:Small-conductance mechanosensitive channel n=1 Tax=Desulfitobacterium dichloroeliminans (strain LMG P-21439 / DCA1) TaxID=871963 RepID=L0F6D0_DESDL|nr:mechanosensitive ion channel family protein [Desulfitobacterium dichloroeliminans]AGA68211.1 small-conductance mechanosensitive channel [Desulfitobacterium dichloroeliminans LMG P-21439]